MALSLLDLTYYTVYGGIFYKCYIPNLLSGPPNKGLESPSQGLVSTPEPPSLGSRPPQSRLVDTQPWVGDPLKRPSGGSSCPGPSPQPGGRSEPLRPLKKPQAKSECQQAWTWGTLNLGFRAPAQGVESPSLGSGRASHGCIENEVGV